MFTVFSAHTVEPSKGGAFVKSIFKRIFLVLTLLSILITSSCSEVRNEVYDDFFSDEFTVTFVFGDERENEVVTVSSGETVTVKKPEREGYDFVGWCTDAELTNFADFTRSVTDDVTFYAKWTFDYKTLLEKVSNGASEKCVKIVSSDGFRESSQGSGVIYSENENYYYVLTNSHVVTKDNGNANTVHIVYDVYGNEHRATLIKNDPSCDLALLKFRKNDSKPLGRLNIDARLPNKNEEVVTVSTPNGKYNTVALGDVVWYATVESDTEVDFEVLWIDGDADHGSSGGAVLDGEMNIIGIIYATLTTRESGKKYVLAIPAPKIMEFLADINY